MIRSVLSRRAAVATTGLAAFAGAAMAAAFTAGPAAAAPATGTVLAAANPIAGSYVVILKDGKATPGAVRSAAGDLAARHAGAVTYTYTAATRGFAVKMSEAQAKRLAADPRGRLGRAGPDGQPGRHPDPATWGLDRIDQRDLPLNSSYTYPTRRRRTCTRTSSTPASGPRHSDFGGRASAGFDAIGDGGNGQRLQRARHARRRHRRRHHLRRGQGASSWSRCGCSTAPAAAPTPASSPASTG